MMELGIGLGLNQPGQLIASAVLGGLMDNQSPPVGGYDLFIDADYVYSDASGTTLCTDGQTIASYLNRATGVVTLPESTGTNRPTYKAGPCFLADTSPAIRFNKSASQWLRLSSYAYNKRAFSIVVVGSNVPGESYVGGNGVPTTTWSLGNSDYYQGTNGIIGEWLFPTALSSNSYRQQAPYCNIHVLGASQRIQSQFHAAKTGAAVAAGTGTGLLIAARGSTPGTFGDLWISKIIAYPRELTQSEVDAIDDWGCTVLGHKTTTASRPVLVYSGNSITAGSGATTPRTSIGSATARRLKDYDYQVINAALGGQSGSTINTYYDNQAGCYFTGRSGQKIAIISEIVNAVQYGEAGSAAGYMAQLESIADKARAAGANYVIGVTAPPQNWGAESSLRAVNSALLLNTNGKFDRVVECRQRQMGYFNATLFADNYHPTDLGSQYLEEIIWRDGIKPIVDPEPNPYQSRIFGHYKCNETDFSSTYNLLDSSGNGNHLPAVGTPGTDGAGARTVSPTAYFESNDYLWQPTGEDFSVFVRFYTTGDGFVFGIRGDPASTAHIGLARRFGYFQWNVGGGDNGASTDYYDADATMSTGAWHTWAISCNRKTQEIRMRRDGGAVKSVTDYYFPWVSMITNPYFFFGGTARYSTMPAGSKVSRLIYWRGYKLTDQQMLDLHNGIYPS